MIDLNPETVMIYAVKCYDKPHYVKSELEEEISRLKDSFGTKVDQFVLGSAPVLDEKKREREL